MEDRRHTLEEKYLKNRIVIPAYALIPESVPRYVKTIEKYRPEYIYGYSSVLFALSTLIIKQNLRPGIRLKAVVSTSETLYDFQREAIKNAFSCPVVNEYGARDGGILAYECPEGPMHVSAENAILEVVDPCTYEPLETGRTGLLLVTDLNNVSMPRLRYALGDMAALCGESCPCGRGMTPLKGIVRQGRRYVCREGRTPDSRTCL